MNKRQRATLEGIFASPTPAGLRGSEVEPLFRTGGDDQRALRRRVAVAIEYEATGSAGKAGTGGEKAVAVRVFHRPHPHPEVPRATVRDIRDFSHRRG